MKSAPDVAQNLLESDEMRLSWIMHIEADLLNRISNIWPGKCEVLQGASKAPKIRILNMNSISRELRVVVHRSRDWLAIYHASPTEDINHVLVLGKKQTPTVALNLHAQEVM